MLISCDQLIRLIHLKDKRGLKLLDVIATTLLLLENHGRVSIAKKLGCTERRARNIIDFLKRERDYFLILQRVLTQIRREELHVKDLDCRPIVYHNLAEDLVSTIMQNVVELRDYIIIHSGNPDKIEIIGIVKNGKLEIPGLPLELATRYASLTPSIEGLTGVVTCWREYNENTDDAIFILSLVDLCRTRRV